MKNKKSIDNPHSFNLHRHCAGSKSLNKKGIFFTTLAIVILTLFLVSYTFFSVVQERKGIQRRVETMNDFIFSVEEDIPRQLFISGFRMIFIFQDFTLVNGLYVSDLDDKFQELFYNGTFNGVTNELMIGTTFIDIENEIKARGDRISVDVDFGEPSLLVTQDDPWNVKFTLSVSFNASDKSGLARWDKDLVISGFVPIEGFEDPVYIVETQTVAASNKIKRTTVDDFSVPGALQLHASNQFYTNSTGEAPSFLDRLKGDLSATSVNGIESLVDTTNPNLPNGGAPSDTSIVDHIYFGTPISGCSTSGNSPWVILDGGHLGLYGASC
jgi:hypothetical protein